MAKPKTQRVPLTERLAFGTRKQRQTGGILTPRSSGLTELKPPRRLSKDALRAWHSRHVSLGDGRYRTRNRAERRSASTSTPHPLARIAQSRTPR